MTNTEEIVARVGMDLTPIDAQTRKLLASQAKAAIETAGFWDKVNKQRIAGEQAVVAANKLANEKMLADDILSASRRNEARALWRERDIANAKKQAVINAEISAGSGGYGTLASLGLASGGIAGGFAAGKYIFKGGKLLGKTDAEGNLIKATSRVVDEFKEGERVFGEAAHHGSSVAVRESVVMLHEGIRGAFTRMISSFSIWIQAVGGKLLSVSGVRPLANFIDKFPVVKRVLGPLASIWDVLTIGGAIREGYRWHKAKANEHQTEESLKETERDESGMLAENITGFHSIGKISEKTKNDLLRMLRRGDLKSVYNAIQPLTSQGSVEEQREASLRLKELKHLDEEHAKKMLEFNRQDLEGQGLLTFDLVQRHILMEKMEGLNRSSIEYAQHRNELDDLNRKISLEIKADKEKTLQLEKERAGVLKNIASVDNERPTIEQLAGRSFMSSIEKDYGKGGKWDLSAGDGPYARMAQNAELWKNRQMWDLIHGNGGIDANGNLTGQAGIDRQRRMGFENMLRNVGIDTPAMKMDEMNKQLADINVKLKKLPVIITGTN